MNTFLSQQLPFHNYIQVDQPEPFNLEQEDEYLIAIFWGAWFEDEPLPDNRPWEWDESDEEADVPTIRSARSHRSG